MEIRSVSDRIAEIEAYLAETDIADLDKHIGFEEVVNRRAKYMTELPTLREYQVAHDADIKHLEMQLNASHSNNRALYDIIATKNAAIKASEERVEALAEKLVEIEETRLEPPMILMADKTVNIWTEKHGWNPPTADLWRETDTHRTLREPRMVSIPAFDYESNFTPVIVDLNIVHGVRYFPSRREMSLLGANGKLLYEKLYGVGAATFENVRSHLLSGTDVSET